MTGPLCAGAVRSQQKCVSVSNVCFEAEQIIFPGDQKHSALGSTRSEDVLTDESILPDIVVVVVVLSGLFGVDDLRAWHAVCR